MNVTESTHNAIDLIAEEFVERFRKGERPAVASISPVSGAGGGNPGSVSGPGGAGEPQAGYGPRADDGPGGMCVGGGLDGKLGDYRIVREIGRGGMGIVYEAVQESLGRQVALKVLPKQLLGDSSRQARFEREARAAARLHHTNIVPVFGVGAENGLHYYAMQYIHGLGLDEVLRELKRLKSSSQDGPAAQQNGERAPEKPERHAVSVTVTQALLKDQFDAGGPQESGNEPSQAAAPPLTRGAARETPHQPNAPARETPPRVDSPIQPASRSHSPCRDSKRLPEQAEKPSGRASPGSAPRWERPSIMPTSRPCCTGTSSPRTCCWTRVGQSGSPTSVWRKRTTSEI